VSSPGVAIFGNIVAPPAAASNPRRLLTRVKSLAPRNAWEQSDRGAFCAANLWKRG
jgi:hypothetical protein